MLPSGPSNYPVRHRPCRESLVQRSDRSFCHLSTPPSRTPHQPPIPRSLAASPPRSDRLSGKKRGFRQTGPIRQGHASALWVTPPGWSGLQDVVRYRPFRSHQEHAHRHDASLAVDRFQRFGTDPSSRWAVARRSQRVEAVSCRKTRSMAERCRRDRAPRCTERRGDGGAGRAAGAAAWLRSRRRRLLRARARRAG